VIDDRLADELERIGVEGRAASRPSSQLRARGADMDWDQAVAYTSLRPPKPSTSSNPGLSHEQVAPVDTCQERPFGLDAELMSKGAQRQSDSHSPR
jgi:hypothetical protein